MSEAYDSTQLRCESTLARSLFGKPDHKIGQSRIKPQRRKNLDFAVLIVGFIEQLHKSVAGEVTARDKQRVDQDTAGPKSVQRIPDGRHTADEANGQL